MGRRKRERRRKRGRVRGWRRGRSRGRGIGWRRRTRKRKRRIKRKRKIKGRMKKERRRKRGRGRMRRRRKRRRGRRAGQKRVTERMRRANNNKPDDSFYLTSYQLEHLTSLSVSPRTTSSHAWVCLRPRMTPLRAPVWVAKALSCDLYHGPELSRRRWVTLR